MRYLTTATAILLIALVGCTKQEHIYDSPEATIATFVERMANDDFEGAMDCYNENSTKSIGDDIAGLTDDEIRNLFLKSLENSSEAYKENTPEDIRIVSAVVTYELGDETHTHNVVVENGEWKINITGGGALPPGGLSPFGE